MNFGRTFRLRERMTLNVRAEFFNVFNRVTLGTPSSSNPTQTTTVNNATGAISGFGYYAIGSTSNAAASVSASGSSLPVLDHPWGGPTMYRQPGPPHSSR